ncbi:13603_t:CDS:2 [Acaulospora morrowiae]|uniref:13603_t:CDS:1 n=1 Tax=Acaulospora morrowiae TaxID=94023 RepID=A0A9N8Z2J9_9GLOM|nr:13603_t:CDS:2 [Acaulospora morrowiae]
MKPTSNCVFRIQEHLSNNLHGTSDNLFKSGINNNDNKINTCGEGERGFSWFIVRTYMSTLLTNELKMSEGDEGIVRNRDN